MVEKVKQIASFIRLGNLALIVFYFFVFDAFVLEPVRRQLGIDPALNREDFFLLIMDVLLVTVIGYWMNDWKDRHIDRVNRPARFFAQNQIRTSEVIVLIAIPAVLAGVITFYLGIKTGNEPWIILYPIVLIMLTYYAQRSKRIGFLGNVLVSLLIALLPLLLIVAEADALRSLYNSHLDSVLAIFDVLVIYAGLMFFSNLAREVIKDCEDIKGDKASGARSLPIARGIRYARWVSATLLFVAMALESNFLIFSAKHPNSQLMAILITTALLMVILLIYVPQTKTRFKLLSAMIKLIMVVGIIQLAMYMVLDYSMIN